MPRVTKTHHKKRYGRHHKHSKHYVKVYAPYLPLVISLIASVFLSFWQPAGGSTLAYATEMSTGGLLQATNSHRAGNGRSGLSINHQLNAAAQAKANDMIARNYWSHTTPDGQEPWIFIDQTGYKYSKAGENLAYGFATSSQAVAGWMNSSTHKANMLDSSFTQVGFGYANAANFNGAGQQTVVVALYSKPHTLAATTQQPAPAASSPTPAPVPPKPKTAPAPKPVSAAPKAQTAKPKPAPVNTNQPVTAAQAAPQQVAHIQTLTNGRTPWAFAALATSLGGLMVFWLLHHSLRLRHLLADGRKLMESGERLILHHPLLDATLLSLTVLGLTLSRVVGTIL